MREILFDIYGGFVTVAWHISALALGWAMGRMLAEEHKGE